MADTITPDAPKPTTWIQYAIVYPTLLLALGGAVPTVIREVKSWRLGVRSSQLELVQEQQRLWERNLPCIEHQGIWEVDGPDGLVVRVSLCRTGDVLLRYHDNDWPPVYRWVARPARKGLDDAPQEIHRAAAPSAAPAAVPDPARRLRGGP